MSGAADNEAKVVISADPAAFAKFMVDAARSFRELEKEGKKSVSEIDKTFTKLKENVKEIASEAIAKVFATVANPAKHALDGALASAKEWRAENTRLMGATGEDWKKIGAQIDEMSRKTGRMPQDVRTYASAVREVTDNWKTAREGAEDYSDLSRYLGRQSVSEMAPLAATMDTMFGVRGQGKAREFFDAAIRGAEKLGQSGRQAVQSFERLAPMLGMQTAAGARGEKFAAAAAAMLPALRKQGLSPEQAEATVAQASSYFSGDLQGLQRQLRSSGQLGRKERLQDEYGRLKYTLPELIGMVSNLSAKHAKGLGGGADLQLKLLQQNMPGLLAGATFNAGALQRDVGAALSAPRIGDGALTATAQSLRATPEMQRQLNDFLMQRTARKSVGEQELWLEDQGAAKGADLARAAGLGPERAPEYLRSSSRMSARDTGYPRELGPWRSTPARGQDSLGPLRPPEQLQPANSAAAANAAPKSLLAPSERQELARDFADSMAGKVLTVRSVPTMVPMSGGGNQTF